MSGAIAGLIGSLKAAVAGVVNKYFIFPYSVDYSAVYTTRRDIVVDADKNVYFGVGLYIYKYNKQGDFQWAKSHGGKSGAGSGAYLAIDSTNIYVSTNDSSYMHIATALSLSDGSVVWSKKTTVAAYATNVSPIAVLNSTQLVMGLNHYAMDSKDSEDGNVVILSKSDGSMTRSNNVGFPVNTLTADLSENVWFLAGQVLSFKLNSTLVKQQVYSAQHYTIKFDSSGNIYFCSGDIVGKYNSSLTRVWQKKIAIPSASTYGPYANNNIIDVDSSGNVYFLPGFERQTFGQTAYTPIVKLSASDGSTSWAIRITLNSTTGLANFDAAIRLASDTDLLVNYGTYGTVAKIKSDGSLLSTVTSSGSTSVSIINYAASITSTNNTAILPFATTISGYGNYPISSSIYGWSTNTFTQTSGTALTNYYTYT